MAEDKAKKRARDAIYRASEEGRAKRARWRASEQGRARMRANSARHHASDNGRAYRARYEATDERRRSRVDCNARRIHIGGRYHSMASTQEQARLINAHIKGRVNEFKQGQQARKEAESVSPGAVPTEANH